MRSCVTHIISGCIIVGFIVSSGVACSRVKAVETCTDSGNCDTQTARVPEPEPEPEPVFILDTDTAECVNIPWHVESRPINLLILLDRSKSMEKFCDEALVFYRDAVRQAIDAIVERHAESGLVNFALNVFPSPEQCTQEYHADNVVLNSEILCQAASQFVSEEAPFGPPVVPFSETMNMDVYKSIYTALYSVGNCGGTPIAKSLQWARAYLESLDLQNDTYVLLATDGAPGCNLNGDIATCESSSVGYEPRAPEMCLDDWDSFLAVSDLQQIGVNTFVLGVGQQVTSFSDVMEGMAYWGTHPSDEQTDFREFPEPPEGTTWHYPAADADAVSNALSEITTNVIDCVFTVNWSDVPAQSGDNQPLTRSCARAAVSGTPANGSEAVALTYMTNCDFENPQSEDTRLQLGWTWEGFEDVPWADVAALQSDVSMCGGIKLCPNACAKLQSVQGVREWQGISASFGCHPPVVVE